MNKYLNYILVTVIVGNLLCACADFFDKEPMDKFSPKNFFKSESDLMLYANSFYQKGVPSALAIATGDAWADYSCKSKSPIFISGDYSAADEPSWEWSELRNINYFIHQLHLHASDLLPEVREHYEGIARFFRARFYFDKVITYGEIPWFSDVLGTSSSDLYKRQDPRTLIMDSVLYDIDFACNHIRSQRDNTCSYITKWAALAMKSRICLFEGTFRKYHDELGLQSTADAWLRQAAEASFKVMAESGYTLHNTGKPQSDYRDLFVSENPCSDEVIWANVYNAALGRYHDITWKFNSATYGSRWCLIRTFINTYLMRDGSRFTDKKDYNSIEFTQEMSNRDYRLEQTIRSVGYKRSDGTDAPPSFTSTYTGYHILKFSVDDKKADSKTLSNNSIPILRYAEVLLNYAEAKAELGEFNEQVWSETIAPLRKRAGVSQAMPNSVDTYLQTFYFPEINDKYLLEIRRERGVELCYEGMRYHDLLRWKKGNLVSMRWTGIYVAKLNQLMDLDGNGKPDVCFVSAMPQNTVKGVTYYIIDNKQSFLTGGDKGNVTWGDNEKRTFSDKKYYHPISHQDLVENPNLYQNPLWVEK